MCAIKGVGCGDGGVFGGCGDWCIVSCGSGSVVGEVVVWWGCCGFGLWKMEGVGLCCLGGGWHSESVVWVELSDRGDSSDES